MRFRVPAHEYVERGEVTSTRVVNLTARSARTTVTRARVLAYSTAGFFALYMYTQVHHLFFAS